MINIECTKELCRKNKDTYMTQLKNRAFCVHTIFLSTGKIVVKFVDEIAKIIFGGYQREIGLGTYNFSYNAYKKIIIPPFILNTISNVTGSLKFLLSTISITKPIKKINPFTPGRHL
jgi:hypothetical protein